MTIEEKIETIKKALSKRSKESIIYDICENITDVEELACIFDIYLDD